MKTKILIGIFLIVLCSAAAQKKNTGLIKYVHQDNLLSVEYNALLAIDGRKTYYVTAQDSLGEREKINTYNNSVVEAENYNSVKKTLKAGFQVFNDLSKPYIYFSHALSLNTPLVYVQEKRPIHDWKLSNDTKEIAGYVCKAATTIFRGRKYTCWYATDLPLPYGPWKLMGLPGIILGASSEDGAYKVSAVSVKFPSAQSLVPHKEKELLATNHKFYPLQSYIEYQRKFIKEENEIMRLSALKYNVKAIMGKERDNYLEIFGK
ncbi:GLPGLI family protein [Nonlabens antarcticus]|uniref:GLPGLI family protein n=1 Tax=Nonlabens antarcticus TaxID=392714 RepID=UPI001890E2DC|nr:GLPGLI family protein [Nonlabens antarcticus]